MRCVYRKTLIVLLVFSSTLFGKEADPEVQKWLQELGTKEEVRFQALNKLVRLGDKSIEPTRKVLDNSGEPSTRRWQAAKVLGALKAEVALPELLKALDGDDHPIVTGAAAEALGRIGDPSVLPQLKKALSEQRTDFIKRPIEQAIKSLEDE